MLFLKSFKMNNNQKLKLFWKISKHINKKFCDKKLKIKDIILFKKGDLHKSFPDNKGWYFSEEKQILINKEISYLLQITILAHELAHAYQHQILGYKGRIKHNKRGGELYYAFLKEIDNMVRISV